MTLLNAHKDVHCSGEQFNPYAIVGVNESNDNVPDVHTRDSGPMAFLHNFYKEAATSHPDAKWTGFKYMVGHNVRVLKHLGKQQDIRIIYVWRRNKLAQISSLIKANESKRWAQIKTDAYVEQKVSANPRKVSQHWHEFATYDTLMPHYLRTLPNKRMSLEYCDMFQPGFEERICDFLDIAYDPGMKSPLVKQGSNRILDRFEKPEPIESYFKRLGLEHWLEDEI